MTRERLEPFLETEPGHEYEEQLRAAQDAAGPTFDQSHEADA